MFERPYLQTLKSRVSEPRNFIQMVMGPVKWAKLESAVGAHLINNAYAGGYNIHYWREGGHEVDFVLERRGRVVGLEVKSGKTQTGVGMPAFRKAVEPDKVLLIGSSGIPWETFLEIDPVELF